MGVIMAKIMLVEDDKSLREIYGVRLSAEGYEIISAGDGEEALAMAVKEKPDLILSDVMMPKISGFDMLDIIRATPETKDLKIIMMTALSSEDQRARGESLGANKYLVKSQVGIEDVVRAVHEVIGDMPIQASPKPVEFTTPVATTTIETTPEPEVALKQENTAISEPTQTVAEPTPEVVTPQPAQVPVQPVEAPEIALAPQESSLPQPTAPFSTSAPHSSLGERVINPLSPVEDKPDISSLINQELNNDTSTTSPPTPQI